MSQQIQQGQLPVQVVPRSELAVPQTVFPEVAVDKAKLKEMAEVVERRSSAVAVIPGKGMILMTKNEEGSYNLSIDGIDGSRAEYTINAGGEVLRVGSTAVRDLSPLHEARINMLNEYLTALPTDQIRLKPILAGEIPDFRPESNDALARELQNGYVEKTTLLMSLWAASGGKPSQLMNVIEESQELRPYALTPQLLASVGDELRAEAASVGVDPEAGIKQNRQALETAFQLSNPELSAKFTKMYQELTGDNTTNVVVSSSTIVEMSGAIQIGDGNVMISQKFYDSIVRNFPSPEDQKKIIMDILMHERKHYSDSHIPSGLISLEAQNRYIKKVEENFSNGIITKDEAVARIYAANLLVMAEAREMEREADGLDGLQPITTKAIEKYIEEQTAALNAASIKDGGQPRTVGPNAGGGLLFAHPPPYERTGRNNTAPKPQDQ